MNQVQLARALAKISLGGKGGDLVLVWELKFPDEPRNYSRELGLGEIATSGILRLNGLEPAETEFLLPHGPVKIKWSREKESGQVWTAVFPPLKIALQSEAEAHEVMKIALRQIVGATFKQEASISKIEIKVNRAIKFQPIAHWPF